MSDWWYSLDRTKVKKGLRGLGAALIVMGIYFFFFDVKTYEELSALIEEDKVVLIDAEVTKYEKTRVRTTLTSTRKRTKCDVEYEYLYEGRTYVGLSNDCIGASVGETIEIYVEKDDPWNDFLKSDAYGYKQYLGFLAIIGAGMVVAGFVIKEY